MGSTICSLWPLTTSVDVEYQDASSFFNSSFPSFINSTRVWNETSAPWLGQFAADIFLQGVVGQGQSTAGSSLGDVIRGFVVGPDGTQVNTALVPRVLEAYVRGVLEFSITVSFRSLSSDDHNTDLIYVDANSFFVQRTARRTTSSTLAPGAKFRRTSGGP